MKSFALFAFYMNKATNYEAIINAHRVYIAYISIWNMYQNGINPEVRVFNSRLFVA